MKPLAIHLTDLHSSVCSGHLRMGGSNPDGVEINATSQSITLGGSPWFPIMGEFHFSRYPRAQWADELQKMKLGGIQVIATYIFWNYHEEVEGRFRWQGDRDLRSFVNLCGKLGLFSYPRIGPWSHGEARNGGFPDWLLRTCGTRVRSDDPQYLVYSHQLYAQIAAQLDGLLWKDGGPVIGIQLENELYDNAPHLFTLKQIAREVGLDVPLYTMTGWGSAQVPEDEVIPVFGGYPDAFWDRHHDTWSRSCRKHFFFSSIRDDNAIGADLHRSASAPDLSYLERYPYGTCELGGGMPPSYHRRPVIDPRDVEAIAFCKLGSGANMLGYYMYHGGTHAVGNLSTLQESQSSGYPNDLPIRSYDFQAPLGEFGQVRPHYHRLRRLHQFLEDFGSDLTQMPAAFPSNQPDSLDDRTTPRWAVRTNGKNGYIFANTYQRIEELSGHSQIQFQVELHEEILTIPALPVDIPAGIQVLWPFNFDMDGIRLRYSTANPICRIDINHQACYVFYAPDGLAPEFAFDPNELASVNGAPHHIKKYADLVLINGMTPGPGCLIDLQGKNGAKSSLLILSSNDSLSLWKIELWGEERLIFSSASVMVDQTLHLSSRDPDALWFAVVPPPQKPLMQAGSPLISSQMGIFTLYRPVITPREIQIAAQKISPAGRVRPVVIGPSGVAQAPAEAVYQNAEIWTLRLPLNALDNLRELYIQIEYTADAARAYLGGEMIASMDLELISDDFWSGRAWEIGLHRFAPRVLNEGLELRFLPLRQDAPVYIAQEYLPQFINDQILEIHSIRAVPEYEVRID